METSPIFLKERTNSLELKPLLHKILNEEGDPHLTEQDKNNIEGSGSKCIEAEASSRTRKVELLTFDGSIC